MPLVTIPQGKIGYIFARDGRPLEPDAGPGCEYPGGRLSRMWPAFLKNGGQRGPQRRILREGTYAINLVQFVVITEERVFSCRSAGRRRRSSKRMADVIGERGGFRPVVIKDTDDLVGIVTVHDGPSLRAGRDHRPGRGRRPGRAGRPTTTTSRTPIASCAPAVCAAANYRCWSKAPTISTACSPRSR